LDSDVLAGIDCGYIPVNTDKSFFQSEGNGTWLGITKTGLFSFVTNYREDPKTWNKKALSRGYLVRDYLLYGGQTTPQEYVDRVAHSSHMFNGFNLVVGNVNHESFYVSNRSNTPTHKLNNAEVYALSNGTLDNWKVWPKARHGRQLFENVINKVYYFYLL
jgi:uncharacterized protein with NRDE domain